MSLQPRNKSYGPGKWYSGSAYTSSGHPDKGQNEDALFYNHFNDLIGVCDGVGMAKYGGQASQTLARDLGNLALLEKATPEGLHPALMKINGKLMALEDMRKGEFQSTLAGVCLKDKAQPFMFWCGDSRILQIRGGKALFTSIDHNEALMGLRGKECLRALDDNTRANQNILFHCLGYIDVQFYETSGSDITLSAYKKYMGDVEKLSKIRNYIHYHRLKLQAGDILIIASDALFDNLNNHQCARWVGDYLQQHESESNAIQKMAKALGEYLETQMQKPQWKKDHISLQCIQV